MIVTKYNRRTFTNMSFKFQLQALKGYVDDDKIIFRISVEVFNELEPLGSCMII